MSEPFCGNCGYKLTGLTDSSKCPECGKPLVEVLQREKSKIRGRRYTSDVVLFGLPLLHIAMGPHEDEPVGRAKGIIAIGDVAVGWLAIGGRAFGIVALGGLAGGLVSLGGMSFGLLAAGGWALGVLAMGGGAVGGAAMGGGAVGYVAIGGGVVGYYAKGGGVAGKYVVAPYRKDAEAEAVFAGVERIFTFGQPAGTLRAGSVMPQLLAVIWFLLLAILIAAPFALAATFEYWRQTRKKELTYR